MKFAPPRYVTRSTSVKKGKPNPNHLPNNNNIFNSRNLSDHTKVRATVFRGNEVRPSAQSVFNSLLSQDPSVPQPLYDYAWDEDDIRVARNPSNLVDYARTNDKFARNTVGDPAALMSNAWVRQGGNEAEKMNNFAFAAHELQDNYKENNMAERKSYIRPLVAHSNLDDPNSIHARLLRQQINEAKGGYGGRGYDGSGYDGGVLDKYSKQERENLKKFLQNEGLFKGNFYKKDPLAAIENSLGQKHLLPYDVRFFDRTRSKAGNLFLTHDDVQKEKHAQAKMKELESKEEELKKYEAKIKEQEKSFLRKTEKQYRPEQNSIKITPSKKTIKRGEENNKRGDNNNTEEAHADKSTKWSSKEEDLYGDRSLNKQLNKEGDHNKDKYNIDELEEDSYDAKNRHKYNQEQEGEDEDDYEREQEQQKSEEEKYYLSKYTPTITPEETKRSYGASTRKSQETCRREGTDREVSVERKRDHDIEYPSKVQEHLRNEVDEEEREDFKRRLSENRERARDGMNSNNANTYARAEEMVDKYGDASSQISFGDVESRVNTIKNRITSKRTGDDAEEDLANLKYSLESQRKNLEDKGVLREKVYFNEIQAPNTQRSKLEKVYDDLEREIYNVKSSLGIDHGSYTKSRDTYNEGSPTRSNRIKELEKGIQESEKKIKRVKYFDEIEDEEMNDHELSLSVSDMDEGSIYEMKPKFK